MHDQRFNSEEKCIEFLEELRWEKVPTCTRCGNQFMNYYLASNKRYNCSKCKYQFNVKSNTIFQNTKLDLKIWFRAIYLFMTCKRGMSSIQISRVLGTEQRTAWYILMKLRTALEDENNKILKGIVEVDETLVYPVTRRDMRLMMRKQKHEREQNEIYGLTAKAKTRIRKELKKLDDGGEKLKAFIEEQKMKAKRGKRVPFDPAIAILGMYEPMNNNLVLHHLGRQHYDTTKEKIVPLLKKHIDLESVLVTDESGFYTEVGQLYKDHKVVNHEKTYVNKDGTHTNNVENVWNNFKKVYRTTYVKISFGHFYRYLNEFARRWNVRKVGDRYKCDGFFPLVFGKKITIKEIVLQQKIAA